MEPRLNVHSVNPAIYRAMRGLEDTVRESGLEAALLELVRMRASMLNGCAYCIDMHSKDARAAGESEQRLYGLSAWHETPFYTPRERAALAWTDALTLISDTEIDDDLYESVREEFSKDEIAMLTLAIVAINGWNRFAIGFRSVPGSYQAPSAASRS